MNNGTYFFQTSLTESSPGTYEATFDAISNRTYVLQTSTTLSLQPMGSRAFL
jgi:hypothetical protein